MKLLKGNVIHQPGSESQHISFNLSTTANKTRQESRFTFWKKMINISSSWNPSSFEMYNSDLQSNAGVVLTELAVLIYSSIVVIIYCYISVGRVQSYQ